MPAVPQGERVYAIGDIHGRLDLFTQLLAAIDRDDAERKPSQTSIVLLGDLVDRGPDSAGVIALARRLVATGGTEVIMGNHEEMFLLSFDKVDALRGFLKFGGRETLASYGIDVGEFSPDEAEALQQAMRERVPMEDLGFIHGFEKFVRIGDYVFVHAGLRPDTPLEMQLSYDCRWIREPFLSHQGTFPGFVVHGHTVTAEPDTRTNRIGIDTGAYMSGRLTALGLEGTERWIIQTEPTAEDEARALVSA